MDKIQEQLLQEVDRVKGEARERALGYITGAFGVVAGLAWNDFVKALIQHFFPLSKDTLVAKLLYALLMTVVVVGITIYLSRLLKGGKKEDLPPARAGVAQAGKKKK